MRIWEDFGNFPVESLNPAKLSSNASCAKSGRNSGKLFEEITHNYPEKSVHLKFFVCELVSGDPQPLGCAAFKWIGRQEFGGFEFPAADAQLLEKLRDYNFP